MSCRLLGHNVWLLMKAIWGLLHLVFRQPSWICHVRLLGHNVWLLMMAISDSCHLYSETARPLLMSCRPARSQCLAVNDGYIWLLSLCTLRQPGCWWCNVGLLGHNTWLLMIAISKLWPLELVLRQSGCCCHVRLLGYSVGLLMMAISDCCHLYSGSVAAADVILGC